MRLIILIALYNYFILGMVLKLWHLLKYKIIKVIMHSINKLT